MPLPVSVATGALGYAAMFDPLHYTNADGAERSVGLRYVLVRIREEFVELVIQEAIRIGMKLLVLVFRFGRSEEIGFSRLPSRLRSFAC